VIFHYKWIFSNTIIRFMLNLVKILLTIVLLFLFFSWIPAISVFPTEIPQSENWTAPSEMDEVTNPFTNNPEATKKGKIIYNQLCAVCHGKKGKGDGMAGAGLNPRPSNLQLDLVQNQSDGALFWKITEGRSPMASYKQALNDSQRWQVVNYIRELRK
jgi:cytochrome c553